MNQRLSVADIENNIDKMFGTGNTENEQQDNNASQQEPNDTPPDGEGQDNSAARTEGDNAEKRGADAAGNRPADGTGAADAAKPKRSPQDLVGPNGEVIARAGPERRWYETAQKAQREVNTVRQELNAAQRELEAYRAATAMPQQLGLNVQDQAIAMQFMAHWKRDPADAAKKMIAELRAAGYNIDEVASGTDVFAIKKVVEEAVAPFRADRDVQTRQQQIADDVQREIEDVRSEFDWVRVNEDALASVIDAYPNAPLREVALRLEAYAARNGLDLYQPLAPQVQARQQPQQQQPNNARGPSGASAANITPKRGNATNIGRSNKDIVREALAEHGIELG